MAPNILEIVIPVSPCPGRTFACPAGIGNRPWDDGRFMRGGVYFSTTGSSMKLAVSPAWNTRWVAFT